jgi:ATP-dependent RNA helicase DDX19/DBP5
VFASISGCFVPPAFFLQGDMPFEDRDRVVGEFRRGETKILISTDVLSRGFDVSQVSMLLLLLLLLLLCLLFDWFLLHACIASSGFSLASAVCWFHHLITCAVILLLLQVTLVVNYDMPVERDQRTPNYETYLHRIGRSGRFGRKGAAFNLITGAQVGWLKGCCSCSSCCCFAGTDEYLFELE